jgi:hypothetical protein
MLQDGLTIARALQNRSVIGNTLATLRDRIRQSAVSDPEETPDFNAVECTQQFMDAQASLRALKTSLTKASINTLVCIPSDAPVPEAGLEVPVYQAVFIRDDLKAQKKILEDLIRIPVNQTRWVRSSDSEEKVVLTRHFDFQATLKKVELLQDQINGIDALIQYTDHNQKV